MTTLRPQNDGQHQPDDQEEGTALSSRATDPNKRVLMPAIKLSEVPTYPDSMTPVGPGASSAALIRNHLRMSPQSPLVIYEASHVPLDRPEDIPYLEQEVVELKNFLHNPSRGSVALRKTVADFLQFRQDQLSVARKKADNQTDKLPPAQRSEPEPQPDAGVRGWLKRFF